jgi:hypothetical protein
LTLGVLAAVVASSSGSNDVEPGVLGFLVVAAMGIALVFLLRSMNKQLRKVTPPPGADDDQDATASDEDPAKAPQ